MLEEEAPEFPGRPPFPHEILRNSELRNILPPRPQLPHEVLDQAMKPGSNPGKPLTRLGFTNPNRIRVAKIKEIEEEIRDRIGMSKEARSIMQKGYGYRYGWPEETDAGRVLTHEIEDMDNEAMLEEAQEYLKLPGADLGAVIKEIHRRFGEDAVAVWVTDTPEQAAWYAMEPGQRFRRLSKAKQQEVVESIDKICVPRSAKVLSDIDREGVLFVASKEAWRTCRNGAVPL